MDSDLLNWLEMCMLLHIMTDHSITYLKVVLKDELNNLPPFPQGVFIPPGTKIGSKIRMSHNIEYQPPLKKPEEFRILSAEIVSKSNFSKSANLKWGIPEKKFMGLEKGTRELMASPRTCTC